MRQHYDPYWPIRMTSLWSLSWSFMDIIRESEGHRVSARIHWVLHAKQMKIQNSSSGAQPGRISCDEYPIKPWLVVWTPLKNDGVRQLGWLIIPNIHGKIIQMATSYHQPAIVCNNNWGHQQHQLLGILGVRTRDDEAEGTTTAREATNAET